MLRQAGAALLTAVGLLLAAACGSQTAPADDVPALADALDRVDEAVTTGDQDAVREAVTALADTAASAQEAGDLEPGAADRIRQAADALLAALEPEVEPTEPTEPTEPDLTLEPTESGEPEKPEKPEKSEKSDKPEKDDEDDDSDEDD